MTTITIPDEILDQYDEMIDRSMKFLDDYLGGPDWVDQINTETLDLNNSSMCVCGQLFDESTGLRTVEDMDAHTGYDYALRHVVEHGVPEDFNSKSDMRMSMYLGFSVDDEPLEEIMAKHNGYENAGAMWDDESLTPMDIPNMWNVLTDAWVKRIEKRRAELGTMA